MRKRDFIATHTFHSLSARKAFFDTMKDRKKIQTGGVMKLQKLKKSFCLH